MKRIVRAGVLATGATVLQNQLTTAQSRRQPTIGFGSVTLLVQR